jgi:kinetochore protein Spc7/SPC105
MAYHSSAIASFTKDLSEASTKLSDQNAKLDKLRAVKAEHTTAINLARGRCDRFTRSDVIRLQGPSPPT